MKQQPKWQYDETKQCGVDYSEQAVASAYDEQFKKFEDFEETARAIIDAVGLEKNSTVIDIGCGTGLFVLHAAKLCRKVYAVDISKEMLNICRRKAKEQGLGNIHYCHAGFLTYEHEDGPVDAVVSTKALHHLPDFWKSAALLRIRQILKPKGKFYLQDLVYSFEPKDYSKALSEWIEEVVSVQGPDFRPRIETAIRQEYKTFGWTMEGLLEKAGFEIETIDYQNDFLATFLCTKKTYKKI